MNKRQLLNCSWCIDSANKMCIEVIDSETRTKHDGFSGTKILEFDELTIYLHCLL